jgi:nucleoside-diphosphate-sugar epimerase
LLEILGTVLGVEAEPEHIDPRPGDVRHTCAEVSAAERDLDWRAEVPFEDGLKRTTEWFTQDDR